jgi:hypothetical protein
MPFRSLSFGPAWTAKALQYRRGSQTQNLDDTYPPFYTGVLVGKTS